MEVQSTIRMISVLSFWSNIRHKLLRVELDQKGLDVAISLRDAETCAMSLMRVHMYVQ